MTSRCSGVEYHKPVLLRETLRFLRARELRLFIDCTVGQAGHLEAVLDEMPPEGTAVGLDRDPEIVEMARERLERFGNRVRLFTGSYADVGEVLEMIGVDSADGFLLDLGLSSRHLEADRGFAFSSDSALDMRFDRSEDVPTARDIVNNWSERDLREMIFSFGEERRAARIARGIANARESSGIETTRHLSAIVEGAVGRSGRIHPSTRTFQALRIAVNSELEHLERAMAGMTDHVGPGGRVVVISYHSLEDRIVKAAMRSWEKRGDLTVLTKKPVRPDECEIGMNRRSRSAKLRASERRT